MPGLNRQPTAEWVYSSLRDDPDFAELLSFFVDEIPKNRAILGSFRTLNDVESLRREAHKLRGSAGGYGFQEVSDLAGQLEESCKNVVRDDATILRNLDELLDYLGKVRI